MTVNKNLNNSSWLRSLNFINEDLKQRYKMENKSHWLIYIPWIIEFK
jgi:hypothetical protein